MHTKYFFAALSFFVFGGVFLFPNLAFGGTSVVITEIGAYEKSGLEWLEIYNGGTVAVDLTGWKFWEADTNHKLALKQGADMVLGSGEYAVITQSDTAFVAAYPGVAVRIIDSSWGSLKESGEEIGLKDANGEFVERFAYVPARNFSLQRIDLLQQDYTSANWVEHTSGNTVGLPNSFAQDVQSDAQTSTSTSDVESVPPESITSPETEDAVGYSPGDVVINELVSDPADGSTEFVELYSLFSDVITLDEWWIEDGGESRTNLSGTLSPGNFFVIEKPKGNLNNKGDVVTLFDPTGAIIDTVTYGAWDDGNTLNNAPRADDPRSLSRILDGQDSDNDQKDFAVTEMVTKGGPNVIKEQKAKSKEQKNSDLLFVEQQTVISSNIVINEVYPNPPGSDREGEFIEIKNSGSTQIELAGWKLGDNSKKRFTIKDVIIKPGEIRSFERSQTGIALNNSGTERVKLFSSGGSLVDEIEYSGKALEAQSYARGEDGVFVWTQMVTPGQTNVIEKPNEPPIIVVEVQEQASVGEVVVFDASDTSDPDGDELNFVWLFGTSSSSTGEVVEHTFDRAGNRVATLRVSDGHGNEVKERVRIAVVRDDEEESVERAAVADFVASESVPLDTSVPQYKSDMLDIRLAHIHDVGAGAKARVNGVVAVEPGLLGSQYFYIVDDGGVQVYMHRKDFPVLSVGDRVEILGETSEAYGETRLKIKKKEDITILEHFGPPSPIEIEIAQIGEQYEGWLLQVAGEVTEVRSSYFYIDDGTEEVKVYVKKGTGIQKRWNVGDILSVVGLVTERNGEYRLLPRYHTDIETIGAATEEQSEAVVVQHVEDTDKEVAEKYLTATAGGLTSILIGLFAKARAGLALKFLRRVGGVVALVVRRGK